MPITMFVTFYIILVVLSGTNGDILFKKGWYVNQNNGTRVPLTDVSIIDNAHFLVTDFLKIKAKIQELPSNSVKNFENLTTLKLASCNIHNINPEAFSGIPKISMIALNDNKIKVIKSGVFNQLNVSTLLLHRNKIKFIESQAFDNMTGLIKLQINSNFLIDWDNNWFKNTPLLSELFVRRNGLKNLPTKAFKNLASASKNIKIYLSKNYISSISPDAFSELKECSQIWLDRNEIVELHKDLFMDMQHLELLYLSKNMLTSVPADLLRHLKSDLILLDLTHNNITCLDYELVKHVKLTNVKANRGLDCVCTKNLKNTLIKNKNNNEVNSDCRK